MWGDLAAQVQEEFQVWYEAAAADKLMAEQLALQRYMESLRERNRLYESRHREERNRKRRQARADAGVKQNDVGAYHRVKRVCPKGHPYSGENLVKWKDGRRRCRKCLDAQRAAHAHKRGTAVTN